MAALLQRQEAQATASGATKDAADLKTGALDSRPPTRPLVRWRSTPINNEVVMTDEKPFPNPGL